MNLWHDISPERMQPEDFLVVIEIEKGSKNKYELDKQTGALRLDRILYTSTHYPANYGFIPRTYADDGDPLDVLVLCSEPIRPMSLVRVYPVGYFTMRDNGAMDDKILAIPFGDPMFNGYSALSDLPAHVSNEISHFFQRLQAPGAGYQRGGRQRPRKRGGHHGDHGGLCCLPAKIQSIERKRFLNLRIAGTFFLDLPCQNRGCMVSSNCKRGEIEAQKRRQYHVLSKVRKRTPGI